PRRLRTPRSWRAAWPRTLGPPPPRYGGTKSSASPAPPGSRASVTAGLTSTTFRTAPSNSSETPPSRGRTRWPPTAGSTPTTPTQRYQDEVHPRGAADSMTRRPAESPGDAEAGGQDRRDDRPQRDGAGADHHGQRGDHAPVGVHDPGGDRLGLRGQFLVHGRRAGSPALREFPAQPRGIGDRP